MWNVECGMRNRSDASPSRSGEAAEEAVYNSLLRAETVRGYRGTAPALPLDSTVAILKRHGAIRP